MGEQDAMQPNSVSEPLDEVQYADRCFVEMAQEEARCRGQDFSNCAFERCRFARAAFEECRFEACTFRECDLSVVKLPASQFIDVRFEGCKMLGVDWTVINQRIFRAAFEKCVLSDSSFARMDMRGLSLRECVAHDCDFLESNLAKVVCCKTDFAQSRFSGTNLSQADFSGAVRYRIDPTMNNVKGAIFSLPEAVSLLRGLGVVIR